MSKKKVATKAPAKAAAKPAAPAKAAKPEKLAKKSKAALAKEQEEAAAAAAAAATANSEDAEDAEDLEESASSGGRNASAEALAAAAGSGEISASLKNFRHHPDMENFYRFIYENDLRLEALAILDEVLQEKGAKRQATAKGAPAARAR